MPTEQQIKDLLTGSSINLTSDEIDKLASGESIEISKTKADVLRASNDIAVSVGITNGILSTATDDAPATNCSGIKILSFGKCGLYLGFPNILTWCCED